MSSLGHKPSMTISYYRFKESPLYPVALFSLIIVAGLLLLYFAVLPQFQNFFKLNEEIKVTRDKISILQNNTKFLRSISAADLQDDLTVTFTALPSVKDFVGIINALNNSAAESGVTVKDYTLAIGELATPSAGLETFFPLSVDVEVTGDKQTITKFLTRTQETLPLSEIGGIDTDLIEGKFTFIFFFKVYKNENYSVATPIAPLSSVDIRTINTIKTWRPVPVLENLPSTESAVVAEPF